MFCDRIGVARFSSTIDVVVLEGSVREHLNMIAPRFMAVLDPIKVVLTNFPENQTEWMDAVNNPEDPNGGSRKIPFTRELFIEREDFMETPQPKFFRLKPSGEVRLRYGYVIQCNEVVKDAIGNIQELRCTFDPTTKSGSPTANDRKVKGTIHWVSATESAEVEVRLYDRLFLSENPEDVPPGKSFLDNINPNSVRVVRAAVEPAVAKQSAGAAVQFERNGYYCADVVDSKQGMPVYNRIVSLKDAWARIANRDSKA